MDLFSQIKDILTITVGLLGGVATFYIARARLAAVRLAINSREGQDLLDRYQSLLTQCVDEIKELKHALEASGEDRNQLRDELAKTRADVYQLREELRLAREELNQIHQLHPEWLQLFDATQLD